MPNHDNEYNVFNQEKIKEVLEIVKPGGNEFWEGAEHKNIGDRAFLSLYKGVIKKDNILAKVINGFYARSIIVT